MFSLVGILGLIFLTYVRPQAFIESLKGVPLVSAVYLLAGFGLVIDLRLRLIRAGLPPLMKHVAAYYAWAVVCAVVNAPSQLMVTFHSTFVIMPLYFLLAQVVQTLRAFRTAAWTLVIIAFFLAIVGIVQGLAPRGCFMTKTGTNPVWDGRDCEALVDCIADGDRDAVYTCERVGPFGTSSIDDRVRWLGVIEDPNELAVCVSFAIPLLIGLYQLRKTPSRLVMLLVVVGACILCVIFTKSRGGQLVFLTALGVYFVRRFGVRGIIVGAVAALPVLLAGGRKGGEESTEIRLEALQVGIQLLLKRPIFGIGFAQFNEYHNHTTHNSYALAGAEMGFPGMYLFVAMMYQSMKSFIVVARRYDPAGPARAAYTIAGAVLAAQAGFLVGIMFLSFLESPILWVLIGLASGFQMTLVRHDPAIERDIRLTARDYAIVAAIVGAMTAWFWGYTRYKLGPA